MFTKDDVIFSYTRAQAIADGVLVDVTETAKEAGFKYPVAVTDSVWNGYIVPDGRGRALGQSEEGRLWDTLWMLRAHIGKARGDTVSYGLFYAFGKRQRFVTLKAVCGPGDDGEPVITIMLPHED
jgi:hypothetical protein